MWQMLMMIALLGFGVFFNPPRVLFDLLFGHIAVEALAPPVSAHFVGIYPDFKILINIPAMELSLFKDNERIQHFKVAVGQKDYPTPVGKDAIQKIIWNPWWVPPDSDWAEGKEKTPPGPKNPLGPVKLELSGDLRMHGTDQDNSIGTAASHACIRMHNRDAKKLAWILQSSLTPYFEEGLLKKYAKQRTTSFYVPLGRPVPVEFVYELIEKNGDKVVFHPDIYHKLKPGKRRF